jgi:hypothetical protein
MRVAAMQLLVRDSTYTDRLAAFLTSVGRPAVVAAPNRIEVRDSADAGDDVELELYLRVWRVLYPDADVDLAT